MFENRLSDLKIEIKNCENHISIKKIEKCLDGFAGKEYLIGVPQKEIFRLFDEYCDMKNYRRMPHNSVGRAIRSKYGLSSKVIRYNGEVIKIYVESED